MKGVANVHYRWSRLIFGVITIVIVGVIAYWIFTRDISALPQPGPFETRTTTTVRDWYIHRAAAHSSLTMPASDASEASGGHGGLAWPALPAMEQTAAVRQTLGDRCIHALPTSDRRKYRNCRTLNC